MAGAMGKLAKGVLARLAGLFCRRRSASGWPGLLFACAYAFLMVCAVGSGWPMTALAGPVIEAGTDTVGGVRAEAQILRVTTLADDGPGSLRQALGQRGPRLIVFDVGGTIHAARDLVIRHPMVTVAGQTAPDPGMAITGASVRIRTHDVVLQHIAIRPGPADTPSENAKRDGLDIGSGAGKPPVHDVLIENVSVSWAVDELVGIWGPGTRAVSIRHSLLAEALDRAGHPEERHSMGLLIRGDADGVLVAGNLFASNDRRNPVLAQGASAVIANNLIYNPGRDAIHFYASGPDQPVTRASLLANIVDKGPDSAAGLPLVGLPRGMAQHGSVPILHIHGLGGTALGSGHPPITEQVPYIRLATPPVRALDWQLQDLQTTRAYVMRHAGARPRHRDPVDQRVVGQVRSRTSRIVNFPVPLSRKTEEFPGRDGNVSAEQGGLRRISAHRVVAVRRWLCQTHWTLGGAFTAQCPFEPRPAPGPVQSARP